MVDCEKYVSLLHFNNDRYKKRFWKKSKIL